MEEVLAERIKEVQGVGMSIDQHREVGYSGERKAYEEANTVNEWEQPSSSAAACELPDIEVDRTQFAEHDALGHRDQISSCNPRGNERTR